MLLYCFCGKNGLRPIFPNIVGRCYLHATLPCPPYRTGPTYATSPRSARVPKYVSRSTTGTTAAGGTVVNRLTYLGTLWVPIMSNVFRDPSAPHNTSEVFLRASSRIGEPIGSQNMSKGYHPSGATSVESCGMWSHGPYTSYRMRLCRRKPRNPKKTRMRFNNFA